MKVEAPTSVDAQVVWPEHEGVEGLSLRAGRTEVDPASADHALAALRTWLPRLDSSPVSLPSLLAESARADRFPYAEVLTHYRRVGRTNVDARLLSRLRYLDVLLRRLPELTPGRRLWPLPEWLPSTIDQCTGNYDSYLVTALLESLPCVEVGDPGRTAAEAESATDSTIDMLMAALVSDLALIEADALSTGQNREQLRRTQACLLLLSRLKGLAPKWDLPVDPMWAANMARDLPEAERLVEMVSMLALRIRRRLPHSCRQAVNLSLLPTTRLHDEQMFVRCIQIFEMLYRQIYRCLVRASAAMQVRDVARACAELADATGRLDMSPVLYRVVTTMPRSSFAIIREFTNGRSAIQSRSYRQIDLVCAPRRPSPAADKLPAVEVVSPTLQDTFFAIAGRLDAADLDRLAAQMRALDAAWRAMKRTHWGITLKIIGRVPGTGGTAGADYLKHAADVPLFPMLADVPMMAQPR
jgi:tryptophan 2,3-dioxygenase